MRHLIIYILLILFITGCNSNREQEIQQKKTRDSLEVIKRDSIKTDLINNLKAIQKEYDYPDFHLFYDDFDESGYYDIQTNPDNKRQKWAQLWIRITIDTKIDTDKMLGFAIVFISDKSIDYTMMQAKVGDSLLTSYIIPTYDNANIMEGGGDYRYVQTVWFTDKDGGILQAIVNSKPNQKISIRLKGSGYYTFSLTKRNIKKIKDAFEFAQYLKQLKLSAKGLFSAGL